MNKSEQINEIATALAKAQAEMKNPAFDSANPHFRNKFASLAAVRNAVVPCLSKYGISTIQELTSGEGGVACKTILTHSSGQWMEFGPLIMPTSKNDAQGFGSASTYAKRYSLQSVAGVVGDDDDDAEGAVGRNDKHDPRGDLGKSIDTKTANAHAKRITDAFSAGKEDAAVDVWREIKDDHDVAVSVWACLPKPIQNRVRDLMDSKRAA